MFIIASYYVHYKHQLNRAITVWKKATLYKITFCPIKRLDHILKDKEALSYLSLNHKIVYFKKDSFYLKKKEVLKKELEGLFKKKMIKEMCLQFACLYAIYNHSFMRYTCVLLRDVCDLTRIRSFSR